MRTLLKRLIAGLLDLMDFIKEIRKSYAERKKFKDYVAQDVASDAIWFDTNAFAKIHDIDGHKILGVFTTDSKGQTINLRNEGEIDGVSQNHGVFYCPVNAISGVKTNQPLTLDGKLYTVKEANLVQEFIWQLVLEAHDEG